MIETDAPDPLDGAALRGELAAAGVEVDREDVTFIGGRLRWYTLDEVDRETVERVVAAHTGEPLPNPQEQARLRFRDAVRGATSIADLKAALLGTDTDAEPDVRPGRPA